MPTQFESLAERFVYEGQMGGFEMFAVVRAAYFDESGDGSPKGRIGVAGSIGSKSQWLDFETLWRSELATMGVAPAEFHAVLNTPTQRALNERLAQLATQLQIGSICVTLEEGSCTNSVHVAPATRMVRSILRIS